VDQEPPPYDEGYADDEDANFDLSNIGDIYAPLHNQADPVWDFSNIRKESATDDVFDDTASNAPELGSNGPDDLQSRMLEDFGDDLGTRPGMTTPEEDDDMPILVGDEAARVPIPADYEDDSPVAELVLDDDQEVEEDHVKID
jgi:ubiquitin carboxyl-terminal hydrolase 4/11/15